jgi:predicted nucleotidyltransferase
MYDGSAKADSSSVRGHNMDVAAILKDKREEILKTVERRGGRNVRVFGSVVRGEADEASDIDLLVRFKPETSLLQHAALIRELRELLGCSGDVVDDEGLRPRMRDRVLREAVPL